MLQQTTTTRFFPARAPSTQIRRPRVLPLVWGWILRWWQAECRHAQREERRVPYY